MKLARAIADPYGKRAANRTATIIIMIVAYPEWLASHFGRDSPAKAGADLNPCAHVGTLSSAAGGTLLSRNSYTDPRRRERLGLCCRLQLPAFPDAALRRPPRALRFGGRATATGTFRGRPGPRFGAGPGSGVAATGSSGGVTSTGGRIATGPAGTGPATPAGRRTMAPATSSSW